MDERTRVKVIGAVPHADVYLKLQNALADVSEVSWFPPGSVLRQAKVPKLYKGFFSLTDYIVFLLTAEHYHLLNFELNILYSAYPDRLVVLCLDQDSYDLYSQRPDRNSLWWALDLEQVIEIIRLGLKVFVNETDLKV